MARIGGVGGSGTYVGRSGAALLIGLALGGFGCHVPAPKPREVLAVGFREPLQAFETFRTAIRGELLELEYRCFSTGFHRRNGLSQLGYREFRDELMRREPLLRWALHRAEVVDVRRSEAQARVEARAVGRTLVVDFVREDFWEIRSGAELLADDIVAELDKTLRRTQAPDGSPWLVAQVPLADVPPDDPITEVRVGSEWKIDDFRLVEDGDPE